MKVGDRVKLSVCGRSVFRNESVNPHQMSGVVMSTVSGYWDVGVKWDNGEYNQYRTVHLEPAPTPRTLTVGETYTTKGGRKLVCIFILDGVAFARFDHGNGVTGEAYRYNLDGTSISHGAFPDEYDIKFEPVVEWVDTRFSVATRNTSKKDGADDHVARLRFPLIDGKPDWSQATITPQPPN